MDKKGTLLMDRTLLSENTLATVFNENAIPAAEIKTLFKVFRVFCREGAGQWEVAGKR